VEVDYTTYLDGDKILKTISPDKLRIVVEVHGDRTLVKLYEGVGDDEKMKVQELRDPIVGHVGDVIKIDHDFCFSRGRDIN
jgi:hypothetical protein